MLSLNISVPKIRYAKIPFHKASVAVTGGGGGVAGHSEPKTLKFNIF